MKYGLAKAQAPQYADYGEIPRERTDDAPICPQQARAARAAAYENQQRIPHVPPLHQQRDFAEIWGQAGLRAKGLTQ